MRSAESTRLSLRWLALTAAVVLVLALVPLAFYHRYYFLGDTQDAFFARFVYYGQMLRHGHWELINPSAWRGGNYAVENTWGLYSPLVMVIAVISSMVGNQLVFITCLKLVFMVVSGTGAFALARSYRVPSAFAFLAGVTVPITGYNLYIDGPTWAFGLVAFALMPWVWWSLRRVVLVRGNPVVAIFAGICLVSLGYPSATISLAVVLVAAFVEALVLRDRRGALALAGVGICCALYVVTASLAPFLSREVTIRGGGGVGRSNFQVADMVAYVTSILPAALPRVSAWWGPVAKAPLQYIGWLLPLLACVQWRRVRALAGELSGQLIVLGVTALLTLGPSSIGPIRWPVRFLPYLDLAAVLVLFVLLGRARVRKPSARRLVVMLAWVVVAGYLSASAVPHRWHLAAVGMALVGVGVAVVWWLLRRGTWVGSLRVAACLFVAAWSVLVVGVQHHFLTTGGTADYDLPVRLSAYQGMLPAARGDVFVVGETYKRTANPSEFRRYVPLGNTWYLVPHPVQNLYSAVDFAKYRHAYCFNYQGSTCPDALRILFSKELRTGQPRVNLLSVSTVVILKAALNHTRITAPPSGWHLAGSTPYTVTWVRDRVVPGAGGVVWASPGVRLGATTDSSRTATARVTHVPPGGGTVVFSRLAYPGYRVSGGALAKPIGHYLLTVHVRPGTAGRTLAVTYTPPGYHAELACGAIAVGFGLLWSVWWQVRVRRLPSRAPTRRSRRRRRLATRT